MLNIPDVTGTDEGLVLVSLGTGLMMGHFVGVLTEPSPHCCQICHDHSMIEYRGRSNIRMGLTSRDT